MIVKVVLPAMPVVGSVAVIVVEPVAVAVARPLASIVAIAVFDELQIEEPVKFCVERSG